MAPIQKDATGTHFRDVQFLVKQKVKNTAPLVVCAQVVLVLTVVAIVLLTAFLVCKFVMVHFLLMLKEKNTAMENVGGVHKERGTGRNIYSPNVGLHE